MKRMRVYMTSISFFRKKATVLLCTDIAAQGLDFPVVHWVVQLDCPETFVELVGRTARYEKDEKTLLFLFPSVKVSILEALQTKKIDQANPKKIVLIQREGWPDTFCFLLFFFFFFFVVVVVVFCFFVFSTQNQEIKHWVQCSFICYL